MPFAPWKMSADHEVHPAVLFLHIPKCGGTTLEKSQALQEFLGLQLCVCLGDARRYGLASGREQCILQLNNYQCSLYLHEEGFGKIVNLQRRLYRKSLLITFLREPLQHLMSQLAWVRAHNFGGAEAVLKFGRDPRRLKMHKVRSSNFTKSAFFNKQCRTLSATNNEKRGDCRIGGAMQRLREFDFIGITEYYEISVCTLFVTLHGYSPPACNCVSSDSTGLPSKRILEARNVARKDSMTNMHIDQHTLHLFEQYAMVDGTLFSYATNVLFSNAFKNNLIC
jgi:hypothetical protein